MSDKPIAEEIKAAAASTNNTDSEKSLEGRSVIGGGLHAFVYSGLQSPLNGLVQLSDKTVGTNFLPSVQFTDKPQETAFMSSDWHAQQLGAAAGTIALLLALRKGSARGFDKFNKLTGFAEKVGIKSLTAIERNSTQLLGIFGRRELVKSGTLGLTYGFALTPVDEQDKNFWQSKFRNSAVSAATFTVLGGTGLKLKGFGLKNEVAAGLLSGPPAGLVNADLNSLLSGKGFATNQERIESIYGFSLVGGAFGVANKYAVKPVAESLSRPSRPSSTSLEPLKSSDPKTDILSRAKQETNPAEQPVLKAKRLPTVKDRLEAIEQGRAAANQRANEAVQRQAAAEQRVKALETDAEATSLPNGQKRKVVKYNEGPVAETCIGPQGDKFSQMRDGSSVLDAADGTRLTTKISRSGLRITEQENPNGTRITRCDGLEVVEKPDGSRQTQRADGSLRQEKANGKIIEIDRDPAVQEAAKARVNEAVERKAQAVQRQSEAAARAKLGAQEKTYAEGPVLSEVIESNGSRTMQMRDGSKVWERADGHRRVEQNGKIIEDCGVEDFYFGERLTKSADGTEIIDSYDGRRTTTLPDGNVVEEHANGTRVRYSN